jgi:hypothetical protein
MGRIPRWLRFAIARGMNKGNCSFFACSQAARFSFSSTRLLVAIGTASLASGRLKFSAQAGFNFSLKRYQDARYY